MFDHILRMVEEDSAFDSSFEDPMPNISCNKSTPVPTELMQFDGTTVLCRVCGDKASGFHYGVHSCEGCKGFFRRSIQQKIQYRPCTKNQQCSILRINRNRCQYCRLKKCIAVGMSRDAVRFGRVPKREKAKILAAMQKVNANSQDKAMVAELEDEFKIMASIVRAHSETCDFTKEKVAALMEKARTQPCYNQYPSQQVCPFNPAPHLIDNGTPHYMAEFSDCFVPAIQGVVEFAKRIPCFGFLSQCDQVTLLKAGVFEVLLVRLACMFDSQANFLICLNGQVLRRDSILAGSNARFLLDSMFDFAERMNNLRLTDNEIGLFCSVVVISADRPGLRNTDLILRVQKKLMDILQKSVTANHPENPNIFSDLMKKIPDLRTLNTLHSEKLLAYKMEPGNNNKPGPIEGIAGAIQGIADTSVTNSVTSGYCAVPHDLWSQYTLPASHPPVCLPEERSTSPGQHSNGSGSTSSSEWSTTDKDEQELVISPRSISSSLCVDVKSPVRTSSFSSSRSYGHEEPWPSESLQTVYDVTSMHNGCPKRPAETNGSDHGSSSGDEGYFVDSPMKAPIYPRLRRVDSPTDSGIESGKEHGPSLTPTISICSSPRSSVDEKVKDIDSDKHESIEDMPVLKRALQAPPIVNPVTLMDEAYRHHKKFRAARREAESPSSPSSQMSLASTHSTLVRTLEQAPRYLSEQQLKRTDLLHHMIMAKETLPPQSPQQQHADSQSFGVQQQPQNNHYPFHSVPTPSPPTSSSPQTHKALLVSQNYYGQQPAYSSAATPVSWPFAQQQQQQQPPASTAPQMLYEPQNSQTTSSYSPSSSPRLHYSQRSNSTSPLVMHGTCTVQSSSESKSEHSQPLNLSKKLFSAPLLKMES